MSLVGTQLLPFKTTAFHQGDFVEVTDETPHCVFIMENIQPERLGDLQDAVDELAGQLEEILGATVTHKEILTRDNPSMELC